MGEPSVDDPAGNSEFGDVTDGASELVAQHDHAPVACGSTEVVGEVAYGMSMLASDAGKATMLGLVNHSAVAMGFDHGGMSGQLARLRGGEDLTQVAGNYYEEHLLVTSTNTKGELFVDEVASDLQTFSPITMVEGNVLPRTPVLRASKSWIIPSLQADGLRLAGFSDHFKQTDSNLIETAKRPNGIAAAPFGALGAVVAWSDETSCNLAYVTSAKLDTSTSLGHACVNPQLAANVAGGTSLLVYEGADGSVMMAQAPHNNLQPAKVVRHHASSPRVMFDGAQFWISFFDERGQVVIGYLHDGAFVSSALPDVRPDHDAYDLALIGGSPYVVSGEGKGYVSQRVCVP